MKRIQLDNRFESINNLKEERRDSEGVLKAFCKQVVKASGLSIDKIYVVGAESSHYKQKVKDKEWQIICKQ